MNLKIILIVAVLSCLTYLVEARYTDAKSVGDRKWTSHNMKWTEDTQDNKRVSLRVPEDSNQSDESSALLMSLPQDQPRPQAPRSSGQKMSGDTKINHISKDYSKLF